MSLLISELDYFDENLYSCKELCIKGGRRRAKRSTSSISVSTSAATDVDTIATAEVDLESNSISSGGAVGAANSGAFALSMGDSSSTLTFAQVFVA